MNGSRGSGHSSPAGDWGFPVLWRDGTERRAQGQALPPRDAPSKLRVSPQGEDRCRPPVAVIPGIRDELVVEGQMRIGGNGERVIGLEDLLRARIRKLAVADQDAEAAGVQVAFPLGGNSVEDRGQADRISGAAPPPALQR